MISMVEIGAARELLLALTLVLLAAVAGGRVAIRVGQPAVVGEIVAGILLGPSLVGALWPDAFASIFTDGARQGLASIAEVGLILFMYLAGLELDLGTVRRTGRRSASIAAGGFVLPMAAGLILGLVLYGELGGEAVRAPFVGFMAVAMAVTALPVLLRILQHTGQSGTQLGTVVTAAAAAGDVIAWCLLVWVLATSRADGAASAASTLALSAGFVVAMLVVIGPVVARFRMIPLGIAVAAAFGCAWVTELIGVHAIFGAFMAGVALQRSPGASTDQVKQLATATNVVLLPVFFVVAGLSTRLDRIDTVYLWTVALVVVAVASGGKIVGAGLGARLAGMARRESLAVGVLMNTRGLTEIVILTIGLQAGIIGEELFAIMVLMALVTTLMTTPLMAGVLGSSQRRTIERSE